MTSFRTAFSDEFIYDIMGEITGSSVITQMPDIPGQLFRLKATSTNDESFWLGTSSGTQPFEMDAGDDTGWFPFMGDNLNNMFYYNVSGSTETMAYWIQK
jgi:hypothetical protein